MKHVSEVTAEAIRGILETEYKSGYKGGYGNDTYLTRKQHGNETKGETKGDTEKRGSMNFKTHFDSEAERAAYNLFIQATDGLRDPEEHKLEILALQRAYELGVEKALTSVNNH